MRKLHAYSFFADPLVEYAIKLIPEGQMKFSFGLTCIPLMTPVLDHGIGLGEQELLKVGLQRLFFC